MQIIWNILYKMWSSAWLNSKSLYVQILAKGVAFGQPVMAHMVNKIFKYYRYVHTRKK